MNIFMPPTSSRTVFHFPAEGVWGRGVPIFRGVEKLVSQRHGRPQCARAIRAPASIMAIQSRSAARLFLSMRARGSWVAARFAGSRVFALRSVSMFRFAVRLLNSSLSMLQLLPARSQGRVFL